MPFNFAKQIKEKKREVEHVEICVLRSFNSKKLIFKWLHIFVLKEINAYILKLQTIWSKNDSFFFFLHCIF